MLEEKDVLIVDDSEECVIYLTEILEEMGCPYRVARNGKEGMQAVRDKRPDLVLLDLMMPQKGGIAVYQEMKRDPELEKVPIFIITGASEATGVDMISGEPLPTESYGDDFTRRFGVKVHGQLKSLAPDVFIEKPIDHEDVARRIKDVLS
ncbi:response regulator [bacterium]|nr:response regulator [bacterium]MBU1072384.1 response regulator [bacterium]MBU1675441.1 response regulator [bacterium]